MASIIEGFNYDIFISYRQKDNKGEKWVSEFVDVLKVELDSAFKEEVSVYFDVNLHDGVLETHDVDASLMDKLKCLVFIPIISRTYCDPKSFAWQHEFLAFIEQASSDRFGLKIRLPNGNVSSRVLPVRIHDLDHQDIILCETAIGGLLRSIDFIYKSAGVNRPLRYVEDNPRENLNHTSYRDQINKVANAIREIVDGLKNQNIHTESNTVKVTTNVFTEQSKPKKIPLYLKIAPVLAVIAFALYFIFFSNTGLIKPGDKIAMLPLEVSDESLKDDEGIFAETINDKLKLIGMVPVPRITMLQYSGTRKKLVTISRELNSEYILYGNMKREGGKLVIWMELASGKAGKSLWSNRYTTVSDKIQSVTDEILNSVSAKIQHKGNGQGNISSNADASRNLQSANAIMNKATFFAYYGSGENDDIRTAIEFYDKAINSDTLLAEAYALRSTAISWGIYNQQIGVSFAAQSKADAEKSLMIRKNLPEGHIALGFYYYYCRQNESDKALEHFKQAADLMPYDYHPVYYMALVHRWRGEWNESQQLMHKVIRLNPTEALFLTNIGISYDYMHDHDSALIFHTRAVDIMPRWKDARLNKAFSLFMRDGSTKNAWAELNEATGTLSLSEANIRFIFLMFDGKLLEAMKLVESAPEERKNKYFRIAEIAGRLNEAETARIYYDSALINLKASAGNVPHLHMDLAEIYAAKGDRKRALAEASKAINELAVNTSSFALIRLRQRYLEILISMGEYREATRLIDELLTNPSAISVKIVENDRTFDPLRNIPEFKAILDKHSMKSGK